MLIFILFLFRKLKNRLWEWESESDIGMSAWRVTWMSINLDFHRHCRGQNPHDKFEEKNETIKLLLLASKLKHQYSCVFVCGLLPDDCARRLSISANKYTERSRSAVHLLRRQCELSCSTTFHTFTAHNNGTHSALVACMLYKYEI